MPLQLVAVDGVSDFFFDYGMLGLADFHSAYETFTVFLF